MLTLDDGSVLRTRLLVGADGDDLPQRIVHHGLPEATNLSIPLSHLVAAAGSDIVHWRVQHEAAEAVHIGTVQATFTVGIQTQVDGKRTALSSTVV